MCDSNVGVARRIEVESVSKEIAELMKELDKDVGGEHVDVPVKKLRRVTERLTKILG